MKKNKLKEGALNTGIQSYQTSSVQQTSSSSGKRPTVNIKKNDLKTVIPQLKGDDINVNVVEGAEKPKKYQYISDIIDENGELSKPFTINGKNYQMVRALSPKNEKVLGVYSLDEVDGDGDNVIHDVNEFEKALNKKQFQNEEGVVEPDGPEMDTLNPIESVDEEAKTEHPSFAGHKHFIVNKKTGKARKFKDISELAKAQMTPDEQYMGIREFKKYVDETLFGAGRKQNVDEVAPTGEESEEEMSVKAKKLMNLIEKRVPAGIFKTIRTPVAQRQVIAAFAEMIGVPRAGLSNLIAGLKDLAHNNMAGTASNPVKAQKQQAAATPAAPETQATGAIQESKKSIKVKNVKILKNG